MSSLSILLAALVASAPPAPQDAAPPQSSTARGGPQASSLAGGAPLSPGQASPAGPSRADPCPPELSVLVTASFARRVGLTPGDSLAVRAAPGARPCPARVEGTYRPAADPSRLARERPPALFHLPQLARLAGREGRVDRFSVRLRPGADTGAVARRMEALLPGARVLPTPEVAEAASTTFQVVRRFHGAIGVITLVAGSVFLACIMVLKVQERRTEVAALRLAGISRRTLAGWVVAEAALVSVLGGLLGLGLGRLASGLVNRLYQDAYDTSLVFSTVTGGIMRQALLLAVVLGLGAGVAATARLLALDPLEEVGR